MKNLESQFLLDKRISQAKEDCNQIRRASVMAMGPLSPQRFVGDFSSPSSSHRQLSGSNSLRAVSPGSLLEPDVFRNGTSKHKIPETMGSNNTSTIKLTRSDNGAEVTEKRTDSRSVKSRTCVVM